MAKTIIGLFNSMDNANGAVQALIDSGIKNDDISVITRDQRGEVVEQNAVGAPTAAGEGAGAGAVGGAVLGGALGLLVGAGLLAIPGIGPVLAAGPLAAAIGTTAATAGAGVLGAGIGAAAGGLMGGLIGAGVPEEDARLYTEGVKRGDVLVSVLADDRVAGHTSELMHRYGAVDLESRRGLMGDGSMSANPRGDSFNNPARSDTTYSRSASDDVLPGDSANTGDFARGMRDETPGTAHPDYARGMHSYNDYESDFRSHYQSTYGSGKYSYEDYSPAYRYGYSLVSDTRLQGERWEDVEMDARRNWEHDRPNSWEEFKSTVRYAWERARGLR